MSYKVLIVDDQIMSRQLFENFVAASDQYELAASVDTAKYADAYCAGGKGTVGGTYELHRQNK